MLPQQVRPWPLPDLRHRNHSTHRPPWSPSGNWDRRQSPVLRATAPVLRVAAPAPEDRESRRSRCRTCYQADCRVDSSGREWSTPVPADALARSPGRGSRSGCSSGYQACCLACRLDIPRSLTSLRSRPARSWNRRFRPTSPRGGSPAEPDLVRQVTHFPKLLPHPSCEE